MFEKKIQFKFKGSTLVGLALISILQTDISLSQDILRHFPFPTWNF